MQLFVFLSWSGRRSQKAAEVFNEWLPDVLQFVRPWYSSTSIESGASWSQSIRGALNVSNYGLIFVTRENIESTWLMFEAGAIAKHVDSSRVIPFIVDDELKPENLIGPLGMFQARKTDRHSILSLLQDMNNEFLEGQRLDPKRLERVFDVHFSSLVERLNELPQISGPVPKMDSEHAILEILSILRSNKPSFLDGIHDRSRFRSIIDIAQNEVARDDSSLAYKVRKTELMAKLAGSSLFNQLDHESKMRVEDQVDLLAFSPLEQTVKFGSNGRMFMLKSSGYFIEITD